MRLPDQAGKPIEGREPWKLLGQARTKRTTASARCVRPITAFLFWEVCVATIGFVFWLLTILWLIFGFYWNRNDIRGGNYGILGGNLLLFILLFLLGRKMFGFPIQA